MDTHTHTRTCVRAHTPPPPHYMTSFIGRLFNLATRSTLAVLVLRLLRSLSTWRHGSQRARGVGALRASRHRAVDPPRGWGPTSLLSQSRGPAGAESFTCVCVRTPCVTDTAGADTGHAAVSTEWTRPSARPGPASALQPALLGDHNGDLGCTHTVVKALCTCASGRKVRKNGELGLCV